MNSPVPACVPAHFGLRVAALIYDLLPLAALWFVAACLALGVTQGRLDVHRLPDKLLMQALMLAFTAAYFIVSWRRGGQTIGMRAWRLRLVRAGGAPLDYPRAALRFAVACLSLGACGLGFFWCLIERDRRAWHDLAAGTRMLRLPAR